MNCYLHRLFCEYSPNQFGYWKHSIPPHFRRNADSKTIEKDPGRDLADIFFVCMVRSPFFWLPANCRRPYEFKFRVSSLDIGERLRSPVALKGREFPNLVQAWNSYYQSYADYLEPMGNVIYIRLEDLVRHPHDVVRLLESRLQRRPGSNTQSVIDTLSGVPCKPDNSFGDDWEQKNRMNTVRRTQRQVDLSFIDQQLDPKLMEKFDYPYSLTTARDSQELTGIHQIPCH
jgi:hypothetical protein